MQMCTRGRCPSWCRKYRGPLARHASPGICSSASMTPPGAIQPEPLPPHVYVLATHVAASPERRPARVRVRAADGTWAVIRAAALTTGSQVPAGYAVTMEAAPADDLAPLLMRAWRLTRREREVARLVIDGLSTEDIATALFISVHTVRDHLKMIFGKTGVSRRQDMVANLTGRAPTAAHAAP
jgi:DNA-binding CsgD family transcriptional regulator